jgi:hypothetical protein
LFHGSQKIVCGVSVEALSYVANLHTVGTKDMTVISSLIIVDSSESLDIINHDDIESAFWILGIIDHQKKVPFKNMGLQSISFQIRLVSLQEMLLLDLVPSIVGGFICPDTIKDWCSKIQEISAESGYFAIELTPRTDVQCALCT